MNPAAPQVMRHGNAGTGPINRWPANIRINPIIRAVAFDQRLLGALVSGKKTWGNETIGGISAMNLTAIRF